MANLREWRILKGYTQAELADLIEEPRPTYQKWDANISIPPVTVQKKLRQKGFDGEFESPKKEITREDLEALRRDLRAHQGWVREELGKDIQALGAMLQELLRRTEHLK